QSREKHPRHRKCGDGLQGWGRLFAAEADRVSARAGRNPLALEQSDHGPQSVYSRRYAAAFFAYLLRHDVLQQPLPARIAGEWLAVEDYLAVSSAGRAGRGPAGHYDRH